MNVISERGIYKLLSSSRKPEVRGFDNRFTMKCCSA